MSPSVTPSCCCECFYQWGPIYQQQVTMYITTPCVNPLFICCTLNSVCLKTSARNNILKKLSNTKWGTSPSTIKTTALALSYSTAEYTCPVWERSTHAEKIDPVLNEACRLITGCLKPTKVESLYQLAGIAPPSIRRSTISQREREKQTIDTPCMAI